MRIQGSSDVGITVVKSLIRTEEYLNLKKLFTQWIKYLSILQHNLKKIKKTKKQKNKSLRSTEKMFAKYLLSIQFIECKFQRLLFVTKIFERVFFLVHSTNCKLRRVTLLRPVIYANVF